MNAETIQDTIRLWSELPEKARIKPTVKVRAEGSQGVVEAGPFSWRTDLPQPVGGSNGAPSPTALLLGALAGCGVVFIRDTLAPQYDVQVEAVEATVHCEADMRGLLGMDGAAPDLTGIRLEITVRSSSPDANVRRMFAAWEERCPIYLALTRATPVELRMQAART
jgi:uncharacterized OsmC-like protein